MFMTAGKNKDMEVSLAADNPIIGATMNVTALPDVSGRYPTNVSVNFGDDSDVEWKFKGDAYGSMGHQTFFNNSKSALTLKIPATGMTDKGGVRLPAGATVKSATMKVESRSSSATFEDFESGATGWTTGMMAGAADWSLRASAFTDSPTFNSTAYGTSGNGIGWGGTWGHLEHSYLMSPKISIAGPPVNMKSTTPSTSRYPPTTAPPGPT
jgi:hypothetical protein